MRPYWEERGLMLECKVKKEKEKKRGREHGHIQKPADQTLKSLEFRNYSNLVLSPSSGGKETMAKA